VKIRVYPIIVHLQSAHIDRRKDPFIFPSLPFTSWSRLGEERRGAVKGACIAIRGRWSSCSGVQVTVKPVHALVNLTARECDAGRPSLDTMQDARSSYVYNAQASRTLAIGYH
jgi:hypothetical protein